MLIELYEESEVVRLDREAREEAERKREEEKRLREELRRKQHSCLAESKFRFKIQLALPRWFNRFLSSLIL